MIQRISMPVITEGKNFCPLPFSELCGLNCAKFEKKHRPNISALYASYRFLICFSLLKQDPSKSTVVENRGQILHILAPIPMGGWANYMSQFFVRDLGLNHSYTFDEASFGRLGDQNLNGVRKVQQQNSSRPSIITWVGLTNSSAAFGLTTATLPMMLWSPNNEISLSYLLSLTRPVASGCTLPRSPTCLPQHNGHCYTAHPSKQTSPMCCDANEE